MKHYADRFHMTPEQSLFLAKKKWDGNKRTSMTLANKILVSAGAGLMTITDKHMEQFNTLLLHYYETGEKEELKDYLYTNAIQGIDSPMKAAQA